MFVNLVSFFQHFTKQLYFLKYSDYSNVKILLILSLFFIYMKELIFTAWISDDAMITLRVVLNLLEGYGARFNIIERVQAYTHPLWFGMISFLSLFTKDAFISTYMLCFLFSFINFLFVFIIARGFFIKVLVLLSLIFSKTFLDYSTSGLENPLSNFLVFLFFIFVRNLFLKEKRNYLLKIFFTVSCMYLTRPDLVVLTIPALLFLVFYFRNDKLYLIQSSFIGFLPVVLWTLFSFWYYGFPFPNTAYAKLQIDISRNEIVLQGFIYIIHSIYRDPITIFIIILGLFLGLFSSEVYNLLVLGILLQIVYVVYIGGDFMEGRFLTSSFFLSILIISQIYIKKKFQPFVMGFILILGFYNSKNTIFSDKNYHNPKIYPSGIADERGYYFQDTGLLVTQIFHSNVKNSWSSKKQITYTCGSIGAEGILRGPNMHIIDTCGLADPLLARLRFIKNPNWKKVYFFHEVPFFYNWLISKKDMSWRIGHFVKQIPLGYIESFVKDRNVIYDEEIKNFYNIILRITRDSLWSLERFKLIVDINTRKILPPNHDYEHYRIQEGEIEIWDIE